MIALKIIEIKEFMNQLLIGNTFDLFPMAEASITTFNTFTINGSINKDFYDTDTQDILTQNGSLYSQWKQLKPFCFSVIRGKRTPLQFKIVFQLTSEQFSSVFHTNNISELSNASSLSLNIQYKNKMLFCTSGISQKYFSLDKRAEQLWDAAVQNFFNEQNISYEIL